MNVYTGYATDLAKEAWAFSLGLPEEGLKWAQKHVEEKVEEYKELLKLPEHKVAAETCQKDAVKYFTASIGAAIFGYYLSNMGTIGAVVSFPFTATALPLGLLSYNVYVLAKNVKEQEHFIVKRKEIEEKLSNGTFHAGGAIDLIIDAKSIKKSSPGTASRPGSRRGSAASSPVPAPAAQGAKDTLGRMRNHAVLAELVAIGILFGVSFSLSKVAVVGGIATTVGTVVAPLLFGAGYAMYVLSDRAHTGVEDVTQETVEEDPVKNVLQHNFQALVGDNAVANEMFSYVVGSSIFKSITSTSWFYGKA